MLAALSSKHAIGSFPVAMAIGRTAANPSKHHSGPYLRFVSEKDNFCLVCRGVLTTAYSNEDKAKLIKEIQEGRREEFDSVRARWLEIHNEAATGVVTKRAFGEGPSTTVTSSEGLAMQVEELHGNLWPSDLFAAKFGRQPKKSELTEVMHKGKKVSGILRDPSDGWCPGVLTIKSVSYADVKKEIEVDNSAAALRDGQLEASYKHHLGQLKVESTFDEESKSISLKQKIQQQKKVHDDEDGCFAARYATSRIAGTASASSSASARAEKADKAGSDAASSSSVKRRAPAAEAQPQPKRSKCDNLALSKRETERGQVDVVLMEAENVFNMMENDGTVRGVSVGRIKTVLKKLEARLQPKSKEVLIWDGDGRCEEFETTGKLQRMQNVMRKMNAALAMMKSFTASPKTPDFSPISFRVAVGEALDAEVVVPPSVRTELLVREASANMDDGDLVACGEVIQCGVLHCPKTADFFESSQRAACLSILTAALKRYATDPDESKARLLDLLGILARIKLVDSNSELMQDIILLKRIAAPEQLSAEEVDHLKDDLKVVREGTSRPMHSVFVQWASVVADKCEAWSVSHGRDLGFRTNLQTLLADLRLKPDLVLPLPGGFELVELAKFKKIIEPWVKGGQAYQNILANVSPQFQTIAATELQNVKTAMSVQVRALETFFARRFCSHTVAGIRKVIALFDKVNLQPTQLAEAKTSLTDSVPVTHSLVYLDKLSVNVMCSDDELRTSITSAISTRKDFKTKISGLAASVGVAFNFACPALRGAVEAILAQQETATMLALTGSDDKNDEYTSSWLALGANLAGVLCPIANKLLTNLVDKHKGGKFFELLLDGRQHKFETYVKSVSDADFDCLVTEFTALHTSLSPFVPLFQLLPERGITVKKSTGPADVVFGGASLLRFLAAVAGLSCTKIEADVKPDALQSHLDCIAAAKAKHDTVPRLESAVAGGKSFMELLDYGESLLNKCSAELAKV